MIRPVLQNIVRELELDSPAWAMHDFENFSRDKQLWDYQQQALRSALSALWLYFEKFVDYRPTEDTENRSKLRRNDLWLLYRDNGLTGALDYKLDHKNAAILADYFPIANDKLAFEHLVNRMSFWMATGSGKTLVIVKLIQLLSNLIERKEIPANDILVLAHRDELLEQFRDHVKEFNNANFGIHIRLHDLKEYPSVKRSNPSLLSGDEIVVFTYRSDLFELEQKQKQIDFRNYENEGKWYVLLDEAHKGDPQDSKRQHIYSVLARNGFLFNFSATFTKPQEIYTTVANFNLAEFVSHGYGKHISILKSQIEAFKARAEDFTGKKKQRIVLQSLLAFTLISKQWEEVRKVDERLYHKPLLITLVNSVNTEDADLKLFFRELERLAVGDVSHALFDEAKEELWTDIDNGILLMFEPEEVRVSYDKLHGLTLKDLRDAVFNTDRTGSIEVIRRPSDRKEIAFKVQNAERPFALIRIGETLDWLKTMLVGYEINETFNDEGFFEALNSDDSDIRILMGSRSFYEGWDSNRPNIINFINIGTQADAKKFVLQSIGRGVRVEPLPGRRRRIRELRNAGLVEQKLFESVAGPADLLETLMIFGTNRSVIEKVVEELEKEKKIEAQVLKLDKNSDLTLQPLLIPTFREAAQPMITQKVPKRYEINPLEIDALKSYVEYVANDTVLMIRHRTEPQDLTSLKTTIGKESLYFDRNKRARSFGDIGLLWSNLIGYFNVIPKEFDKLKPLSDEIIHFENIVVSIEDVAKLAELRTKVDRVKRSGNAGPQQDELKRLYEKGKLTLDQLIKKTADLAVEAAPEAEFTYDGYRIEIKRLASHYYVPVLVSEREKIAFIKYLIKVPSEVEFLARIDSYLSSDESRIGEFDDWAFCRLDETLDSVSIPYVDRSMNRVRNFHPDFVFWFKRGENYSIAFVDPKGTQHAVNYGHKLDGYKDLFLNGDGQPRVIEYQGLKVRVHVFLYNKDRSALGTELYPSFWVDSFGAVVDAIRAAESA